MAYIYSCVLTPEIGGGFSVTFPDVPAALTHGADQDEALAMAEDALVAALGAYIQCREDIPIPSPVVSGQRRISVRSMVAAKLALYSAMRSRRITQTDLAHRMGSSEGAIGKLLDLDSHSRIGDIEQALAMVHVTAPVLQKN